MTRPYTRMELNNPGVRPPLDWKRVVATVEALDAALLRQSETRAAVLGFALVHGELRIDDVRAELLALFEVPHV